MHLLSELGLHESFLECVEQHRRDGLPMALNRAGRSELVPVENLAPEITRARNRIAELKADIARANSPGATGRTISFSRLRSLKESSRNLT